MRRKIIAGLYVGDLTDCEAVGADWSVVHACKHPCHKDKCGQPKPSDANYLSYKEGTHLYLNLIDPPTPLFQRRIFEDFLSFARGEWQANRTLLIHCNKGESRAPSLALLFLAKVLHRITNASYDLAWDEFETLLAPDKTPLQVGLDPQYTPSAGIETWLREHWDELNLQPRLQAMHSTDASTLPALPPIELPTDPEAQAEIVRSHPLIHFAGFTQIEGKSHKWFAPTPNALQFDIGEAYDWCMGAGVAPRIIILKPRQVGCSTSCGHLCYHHMRRFQSDMIVMGDVAKRTEKVYGMFNDYSDHDGFKWDSHYQYNTEKGRFTYADGSEGLVEHDTALDPKAGISGTRQVLWLTEAARYMKTNGRDKKVITAVLNSLANVPKSLGIAESTPEGASGWYYETWQGAATLAERKKGIVGNGWIKVFAPWFAFAEHALKRTGEHAEYFREELDDRERRGIDIYSWSAAQIAWRRMKIAKDCANDVQMFDQDFPEDPESCFLASGRPRFNMEEVARMEKAARVLHGLAETGTLEETAKGEIQFVQRTDGDSWVWVAEKPKYGCRYITFIDPCTGAQNEGSPFPDAHAPGILRASYIDERGVAVPPRLAACIDVPNGCRWDDELVAERLVRLANWYGGCMVVPETGNGLGVLSELRRAGALIYEREKMDAMYPGKKLKIAGWETSTATRPLVVNAMANYIRERGFDCAYMPAVLEFKTFIINDRGKAEAKPGCHDDWVMGIGIGLLCIDLAQGFMPPPAFGGGGGGGGNSPVELAGGLSGRAFT